MVLANGHASAGKAHASVCLSQAMNEPQILYETDLAEVGHQLSWAGISLVMACLVGGVLLCWYANFLPLIFVVIAGAGFSYNTLQGFRLRKRGGVYRISMDDHGLYTHSDDPKSAASFTVIAPDSYRLVRKTIRDHDAADEHEYYVETKSGIRHQLGKLFTSFDLDGLKVFEQIADRFHWVEIHEEIL
ncbi:MAG TPA: hypothetical protein VGO57_18925 [Verrucomicrobiae bacterium]|jgi:hypothetical protein